MIRCWSVADDCCVYARRARSCVGVWQHDRVEIIANDQGNRTTPSYVAFTDTERLIGDAAKNQVALNPKNTVFDAKRLIGRKFSEAVVQQDMKHWPFTVKSGPADKPLLEGVPSVPTSLQREQTVQNCSLIAYIFNEYVARQLSCIDKVQSILLYR
jgi:hypothetical protein